MGDRAGDVLPVKPAIDAHTFGELLDTGVRLVGKDRTPRFFRHARLSQTGKGQTVKNHNTFKLNALRQHVNARPSPPARGIAKSSPWRSESGGRRLS